MSKVKRLERGDKVAIVSLSSGILGEDFISHEIELGEKRLKEFGLSPVYMPNAKKGIAYLKEHPEARAADLKTAFADTSIKGIICAIGGNDTYRTIPFLLEDKEFVNLVKTQPKIFMGFSDSTTNHFMFHRLGLNTFYGPAFLIDFAELDNVMLPYTKNSINYLFNPAPNYQIFSSDTWYEDRTDFSAAAVGTARVAHKETRGYEVLLGSGKVQGELLGGCLDSIGAFLGLREQGDIDAFNEAAIIEKYKIFGTAEEWKDKILFIETSEAKMSPELYRKIIRELKNRGVFANINGVIVGKPIDEVYYEEYRSILINELAEYNKPVMMNLNFGHATPRTILPYGAIAEIDADNKTLTIINTTIE